MAIVRASRPWKGLLVAAVCILAALAWSLTSGRGPADLPSIGVSRLPPEARETLALIRAGGPFPYPKDGSVFGNRERLLPQQPRGYYREYTVRTPGRRDRGARRIVTGGGREHFWTPDHYRSFYRIEEAR